MLLKSLIKLCHIIYKSGYSVFSSIQYYNEFQNIERASEDASFTMVSSTGYYVKNNYFSIINDLGISDKFGNDILQKTPLWPLLPHPPNQETAELLRSGNWIGRWPSEFDEQWRHFSNELRRLGGDWPIWLEWYDGILAGEKNGRYLFGLPTERALTLWRDMALIPNEDWEKGPSHVNALIRSMVAEAKGERSAKREDSIRAVTNGGGKTKKSNAKAEPKTKIGKAIVANAPDLALQTALIIPLIDQELSRLRSERPNSEEAITERDHLIAKFEKLRADALIIKQAAVELPEGKVSEKQAVQATNSFFSAFRECWSEHGKSFAEASIRSGVFLGGLGILKLFGVGVPSGLSVVVLGAIAAEKPLANVLKSAKGMFKFGGS